MVGGTSHAGKSTLASELASALTGGHLSTDSLGRHPGRPWGRPLENIPAHVKDYYLNLSTKEQLDDVLRHYGSLWPKIDEHVKARISNLSLPPLIVEGSAILPETAGTYRQEGLHTLWLTAAPDTLRLRIEKESKFGSAASTEQRLIEAFIRRTLAFDRHIREEVSSAMQAQLLET